MVKTIMGENLIISRVLIVKATRIESLLNLFLFFYFFSKMEGKDMEIAYAYAV